MRRKRSIEDSENVSSYWKGPRYPLPGALLFIAAACAMIGVILVVMALIAH
jgi:hypothetical protein